MATVTTNPGGSGGESGITKSRLGFLKDHLLRHGIPGNRISEEIWTAIRMEYYSTYWSDAAFRKRDWVVLYQFVRKQRRIDPAANRMAQQIRNRFIDLFGHDFGDR
jgi:hypothetical protein